MWPVCFPPSFFICWFCCGWWLLIIGERLFHHIVYQHICSVTRFSHYRLQASSTCRKIIVSIWATADFFLLFHSLCCRPLLRWFAPDPAASPAGKNNRWNSILANFNFHKMTPVMKLNFPIVAVFLSAFTNYHLLPRHNRRGSSGVASTTQHHPSATGR